MMKKHHVLFNWTLFFSLSAFTSFLWAEAENPPSALPSALPSASLDASPSSPTVQAHLGAEPAQTLIAKLSLFGSLLSGEKNIEKKPQIPETNELSLITLQDMLLELQAQKLDIPKEIENLKNPLLQRLLSEALKQNTEWSQQIEKQETIKQSFDSLKEMLKALKIVLPQEVPAEWCLAKNSENCYQSLWAGMVASTNAWFLSKNKAGLELELRFKQGPVLQQIEQPKKEEPKKLSMAEIKRLQAQVQHYLSLRDQTISANITKKLALQRQSNAQHLQHFMNLGLPKNIPALEKLLKKEWDFIPQAEKKPTKTGTRVDYPDLHLTAILNKQNMIKNLIFYMAQGMPLDMQNKVLKKEAEPLSIAEKALLKTIDRHPRAAGTKYILKNGFTAYSDGKGRVYALSKDSP